MNKVIKFLMMGMLLALIAALAIVPATAQEGGQGGIIIEGNLGSDVATMNPALASDTASRRITSLINIGFLGVDPAEARIVPDAPGALVQDWTVSDDGLVYTFSLRQDLNWSDGTPITAADVMYTWEVIKLGAQGVVDTPLSFVIDPTGETGILDVVALDDYTIEVTFASAQCTALNRAGVLYPVPAHVMPEDPAMVMDAEYNLNPTVGSGVFLYNDLRPGEQVSLLANQEYGDAILGYVNPTGFIYKNVPDQNVMVEQFLVGEINIIDNPAPARRGDIRATDAQVYNYPGNIWDYLAFNLADPTNPQNAFDEAGNPIDQGHHPIFGDVRVRQAIARAVDVESIISAAVFNEGQRMTSYLIPQSWAYADDLPFIPFDPAMAAEMLEEAGWTLGSDGVRVATEAALHAEPGTVMEFTLYTNEGNTRRAAIGTLVQDQLAQIGIRVNFQTIDFNTLLDIMDSQTFDTLILGWRNGYPDDPDATQLFTPASDVVGSGSNFTSFNNPRFTELNTLANNAATTNGCDFDVRAQYYREMQEIMQEELPYLWLFAQDGVYVAGGNVEGFDPFPAQMMWNIDTWSLSAP